LFALNLSTELFCIIWFATSNPTTSTFPHINLPEKN